MSKVLFTIGHSTHSFDYFVGLLGRHGVEVVGDVRSIPYSRRNPQFNRDALELGLRAAGIRYVFLGKELGARSSNPACYVNGKVQYSCLAREPLFIDGLQRVRKGIDSFRVALMCAERDPLTCHRTILVCKELKAPEIEINHILADGALESNAASERRLTSMMNLVPDMFHTEQDCINQAYDRQAGNIAYTLTPHDSDTPIRDRPDEDIYHRLHQ
jgi:uncharacterized protein (DUF488 family)